MTIVRERPLEERWKDRPKSSRPFQQVVGNRLREHRQRLGLSLRDVQKITGWSDSTISGYERAERWPLPELLVQLCWLYGITVSSLFDVDPDDEG